MSSNQPNDPNEHLRHVLQYLQQQQQQRQQVSTGNTGSAGIAGNAGISGNPVNPSNINLQQQQPLQQNQPIPSIVAAAPVQHSDSLNALLASFLQGASPSGTGGVPLPALQQPQAQTIGTGFATNQQQAQHQLPVSGLPSASALSQQILSSVERLQALNPSLAAAALSQALSSQQQQQPQQQQPQTSEGIFQQGQVHGLLQLLSNQQSGQTTGQQVLNAPMPANNLTVSTTTPSNITSQATQRTEVAATSGTGTEDDQVRVKEWTKEQLEAHIKQLHEADQPIPQSLAILLESARRKEEKYHAKKAANRKSAYSSRERKKARISAMFQENARLRKESLILYSLPIPVIAIDLTGKITFANQQSSQMLQFEVDDLVGDKIYSFTAPDSRAEIQRIIQLGASIVQRANQEGKEAGTKKRSTDSSTGSDAISLPSFEHSDLSRKKQAKSKALHDTKASAVAPHVKLKDSACTEKKTTQEMMLLQHRSQPSEHEVSLSGASLSRTKGHLSHAGSKRKSPESSDTGTRESEGLNDRSLSTTSNEDIQEAYHGPHLIASLVNIQMLRKDSSMIWCEPRASIHSLPHDDSEYGITKRKSKSLANAVPAEEEVMEILICLRVLDEGNNNTTSSSSYKSEE